MERREAIAEAFEAVVHVASRTGSPLYEEICRNAAEDARAGGIVWELLREDPGDPLDSAVMLRLMAAVHRLLLTGRAPSLAPFYPSVGGTEPAGAAWPVFRETLEELAGELRDLIPLPCQTNEVGRAAALLFGFLPVARETGLPMRLLEIGASAGLNLRWDRFLYRTGDASWGDPASPVRLEGMWEAPPPDVDTRVEVADRRGCDPNPVDPLTLDGRLTLESAVWADQTFRLERLRGAIELARSVPARVDQTAAGDWLPARLAVPAPGRVTVVYHSVVMQYLPVAERERVDQAMEEAGAAAAADAPLARVQMEPAERTRRRHGVDVTVWPGGQTRRVAISGAHGDPVTPA